MRSLHSSSWPRPAVRLELTMDHPKFYQPAAAAQRSWRCQRREARKCMTQCQWMVTRCRSNPTEAVIAVTGATCAQCPPSHQCPAVLSSVIIKPKILTSRLVQHQLIPTQNQTPAPSLPAVLHPSSSLVWTSWLPNQSSPPLLLLLHQCHWTPATLHSELQVWTLQLCCLQAPVLQQHSMTTMHTWPDCL